MKIALPFTINKKLDTNNLVSLLLIIFALSFCFICQQCHNFTILAGFLLVTVASSRWGVKGGIAAALWSWGAVISALLLTNMTLYYRDVLFVSASLLLFILIAVYLGKSIDTIALQKAKLQEREANNRSILQAIPDLIFKFSPQGEYKEIITNYPRKLYTSRENMLGKNVLDVLPPDVGSCLMAAFDRAQAKGQLQVVEYSLQVPEGLVYFEARVVPVGNDELLVLSRDITSRKEADKKINQHAMELELKSLELEELYSQLNEQIDKARLIHERTLPASLPNIEGVSLATHYKPAQKMGGDFYNLTRKGNKLILYLSDVTGHGFDSAMLSVFVKNTINNFLALSPDEEISPKKIMEYLIEQYHQENYPSDYFISIFAAVLNLDSYELSYTGAGFQTSPLVSIKPGRHLTLDSQGLPVSSAFPGELLNFEEKQLLLVPGATILFTTDGLAEQTVADEMYLKRLEEVFQEKCSFPPNVLIGAINEDFRRINHGSLEGEDDITIVALQVEPQDKVKYDFEVKSSFEQLVALQEKISQLLPYFTQKDLFLFSMYELLANAIEHGNNFHPNKRVYLHLAFSKDYIMLVVEDEGEGFNWEEKINSELDLEGDKERGRGIALTRNFFHLYYYNEKGNQATLFLTPVSWE